VQKQPFIAYWMCANSGLQKTSGFTFETLTFIQLQLERPMNTTLKILIIVTSNATMGDTGKPTGMWFEELATPYYAFLDAGVDVQIASIAGGETPIDPRSKKPKGENPPNVERFMSDATAMEKLKGTLPLKLADTKGFDAVFIPGGHGTMWDLPSSPDVSRIVSSAWVEGLVVAAVCHGPAGLVNVTLPNGRPLVKGKRVSTFTNEEEDAAGLTSAVPFLLETELAKLGARIEKGENFKPFAIADGNLVTGQNPASSTLVAQLVLKQIRTNRAAQLAAE
jgi:putative intracellular protease/amidase